MATVYIETSVVSYLTARPSQSMRLAAHQAITKDWWRTRHRYGLRISQLVLDEAGNGHPLLAARRLRSLTGISILPVTDTAASVASALVVDGALPRRALVDAFHIGIAAVHGVDYLLTWNCRHLANAAMRGTIDAVCRRAGLAPPVICTPEELQEGKPS